MAYFKVNSPKVDKINAPLLVVGLGGTGADGLRRVKHEFNERLNPDIVAGIEQDRPPRTAYLAIDTDANELRKSYLGTKLNKDEEWVDLSCNIGFVLGDKGNNLSPEIKDWLDRSFYEDGALFMTAATDGAGTYRQLGRLMLFRRVDAVVTKLIAQLTRLNTIDPGAQIGSKTINVMVITGICGGTGSGTFLDFAYLVRHAAKIVGVDVKLDLYVIAPDVTINKHAAADTHKASIYKCNSFAAFMELDYWMGYDERMNGKIPSEELTVKYDNSHLVVWNRTPYDDVTLLCATNAEGALLSGAYEVVMSAICETLLLQFASETNRGQVVSASGDYSSLNDSFSFQSAKSNEYAYKQHINRPYPQKYCYRAIGAFSNASEQKSKLYMEAQLVFDDARAFCELPAHKPVMESTQPQEFFAPFEQLFSEMEADFEVATPYAVDMFTGQSPWSIKDLKSMSSDTAPHGNIRKEWERVTLVAKDKCATVYTDRLVDKFRDVAGAYIKANGPDALRIMLDDPYNGFIKTLETKSEMYKTQIGVWRGQYTGAIAQSENAFNDLLNAKATLGLFNGPVKEAYDRYIAQARSIYESKRKEMFNEVMSEVITGFKKNVETQILRRNIEFAINALKNIQTEVTEEVRNISEAAGSTTISSAEAMFTQIRELYNDNANKEKMLNAVMSSVAEACLVFDGKNAVQDADEAAEIFIDKINGIINSIYRDVNDVTLEKQLAEAGGLNGKDAEDVVRTQIAPNLERGAQVHFKLHPSYGGLNTGNSVITSYISVPADATAVINGITSYINSTGKYSGAVIKPSNITDRVFWMNIVSGLPLCAYGTLAQYEKEYESEAKKRPGSHLVRMDDFALKMLNKKRDLTNDWYYLPSPVPAKLLGDKPLHPAIERRVAGYEEDVQKAIDAGLVVLKTDIPDYNTFKAEVRLISNPNYTLMTPEQAAAELDAIKSSSSNYEGKIQKINEFLNNAARFSFDPINDVRQNEQIVEFSKPMGSANVFNYNVDVQRACFRELVIHRISMRPMLIEELKNQLAIIESFKSACAFYENELNGRNKLKDAIKTVMQLWAYNQIKFNLKTVVYKDSMGNWASGDDENILFSGADAPTSGETGSNLVPLPVRLVLWFAEQNMNKTIFRDMLKACDKINAKIRNPKDEDIPMLNEIQQTADGISEKLRASAAKLAKSEDSMSAKLYSDTRDTMKAMVNVAKDISESCTIETF